jgi:hypothetical protein
MSEVRSEVGAEPDIQRMSDRRFTFNGEPRLPQHCGARTVSPDKVPRSNAHTLTRHQVAHHAHDAVAVLAIRNELMPHPHVAARLDHRVHQKRLKDGLRTVDHRTRARRRVIPRAFVARAPRLETSDLGSSEGGDPEIVAHQLMRRGDTKQLFLKAQVPHDLDRALVDDVCARGVGRTRVLLYNEAVDPVLRKRQRRRKTGRPCADDQDRHINFPHEGAPKLLSMGTCHGRAMSGFQLGVGAARGVEKRVTRPNRG